MPFPWRVACMHGDELLLSCSWKDGPGGCNRQAEHAAGRHPHSMAGKSCVCELEVVVLEPGRNALSSLHDLQLPICSTC